MSSRKAMSASELTRIRRAQTLSTGVPRPAGTGFSEDLLEKNFVKGPVVVDGLVVSDCCPIPDPEYTVLFYVSDPETGNVPRSITGERRVSPVSAYYIDKKYLDENGKRKSREQVRADLAALRPAKVEKVKAEKQPKYTDISGRKVRVVRDVTQKAAKVKTEREVIMRPRSGTPDARIQFYTGGTSVIVREYVNGSISFEQTYDRDIDVTYIPTQACVLSIVCPGLDTLNISGPNITQIKFNDTELYALSNIDIHDLNLSTPLNIPNLYSLSSLNISESTLQTLTIGYLPDINVINFYNIAGLKKLDFSNVGNSNNLYEFNVSYMTDLTELILDNLHLDDDCYVHNNPSLAVLSISNISYIDNLDIYENNIETLTLSNIGEINNNSNIYDNTIGTLTFKNIGFIDDHITIGYNTIGTFLINGISRSDYDLDISGNTIDTLTIKNIGDYDSDININNNTVQHLTISNIGYCNDIDIRDNHDLKTFLIRDCNSIDVRVDNNYDLETFTIQNIIELDYLYISGPALTSYTLTNVYNMYDIELYHLDAMTSMTIGDPSVNQNLRHLDIYENPNLTSLTLSPMPQLEYVYINNNFSLVNLSFSDQQNIRSIYITNNTALPVITLPSLPSLLNFSINNNNLLTTIHANRMTNTGISGYINYNPALTTLDVSGGTYNYFDIHGNSSLATLDMRNISIYNEINVYSNALTTVYTGIQTIYGRYYIYNEPFLTELNLATVTFVNAGQELNISDNTSLANVTMPTTLVNGLYFYMNNCNIDQDEANVIEEYFFYANSQSLNNCAWTVLNQNWGILSTAAPPGWGILVSTRDWTIN